MAWIGVLILKKLLLILLTLTFSFADDISIEKKIYETFFAELSPREKPYVYVDTPIASLELKSDKFILTDSCKKADIAIMTQSDLPYDCRKKVVFGTRYRHLKKKYVVGAFFWQKGRPNIVFQRTKLRRKNIELSPSLQEYAE